MGRNAYAKYLERDVGLARPVGVDRYAGDTGTTCGVCTGATKEGARDPGDIILLYRDIELTLEDLDA